MSIDQLQYRIRKLKNPTMLNLTLTPADLPPHLLQQEESFSKAYVRFCREVLVALKDLVPAIRFSYSVFSMLGGEGADILKDLLFEAKELGYYVVVDAPDLQTPLLAELSANTLCSNSSANNAVVISPYIGSDALKPFIPHCKTGEYVIFAIIRSPNKSASELQDLQSGTRQVHTAAADIISRYGDTVFGKCGYSQIGALVSAGTPEILRKLRSKYPRMFLLVDGLDYPSGNSKNCSFAFDSIGHGAVVSVGNTITSAWKESEDYNEEDYLLAIREASERTKRNLLRYVNVL